MSAASTDAGGRWAALNHRLADESGFGVLEVLVSALIVVLISFGVFSAIDAAGRTADANKSRSVASDLAQTDQERLRSLTIAQLSNRDETTMRSVDGETYTIHSTGEFQLGPADSTDCTSSEQAPRYLKITSNVTWGDIRGVSPVESESLRVVPNGSTADLGTLSVEVDGQGGRAVAGIPVTITSGATTKVANTSVNGCAVFAFLKPGSWAISGSKPNYVTSDNPTLSSFSGSVVVAADGVATASYNYDLAAGVTVNYKTRPFGGDATSTLSNVNGDGFIIANSGLGSLPYKTFTHASSTTGSSGLVNYPFSDTYSVYSGKCTGAAPPSAAAQNATLTPGGTAIVSVLEPRLRIRVQRRTNATTTATNNYAVMSNDSKTTVKFTPATSGCTTNVSQSGPFTTTSVVAKPIADNTATGGTNANYSTFETTLPYGNYNVCASYVNTTTNRAAATQVNVTNNAAAGFLSPTTLVVPYNDTTTYACP